MTEISFFMGKNTFFVKIFCIIVSGNKKVRLTFKTAFTKVVLEKCLGSLSILRDELHPQEIEC